MININHLNKKFKNGKNSINVINDTSLSLPDTGLITLLGESGSGKTTLLNVIGGLDKFDNGAISYDNRTLSKYKMNEIDSYRKLNISYIFQNYYLLPSLSIYDNLKKSLEIINITDKDEVDLRIKEALTAVNMYKYRKKLVTNLSGGQQQRVAIARALTKKSKLIIADEPTGNLDSDNSLNIMNILKEISKTHLVLLVTHNKNLARHFSDYIYEISDGSIYNGYVPQKEDLDFDENTIYLKDLNNDTLKDDKIELTSYNNVDNLKIQLININGTYYIEANKPIKLLSDTNIKVINKSREEVKEEKVSINYDSSKFTDKYEHKVLKKFFNQLAMSFKSYKTKKKKIRFLRLTLFFIGCISAILTIGLFKNLKPDFSSIKEVSNSYRIYNNTEYKVYQNVPTYDEVKKLYLNDTIEDFGQKEFCSLSLIFSNEFINSNKTSGYLLPLTFNSNKIIYGSSNCKNKNDVIVSKRIIDDINLGIPYQQLIGKKLYDNNLEYNIVGITDSLYYELFYEEQLYNESNYLVNGAIFYNSDDFVEKNYELIDGRLPENNNECLVIGSNNLNYYEATVVGHVKPKSDDSDLSYYTGLYLLNKDQYKSFKFNQLNRNSMYYKNYSYKFKNNTNNTKFDGFVNDYDYQKLIIEYNFKKENSRNTSLILMGTMCVIMVLYIYFTEHAKMMSNIKEVGMLRAIGETRKNISLKYACDSFVEAVHTVTFGYILVGVFVGIVESITRYLMQAKNTLFFENYIFYVIYLLILLIFIVFGSIPSILLTRRTPSEIIAKYDI